MSTSMLSSPSSKVCLFLLFTIFAFNGYSQICNCTVQDVQNNTVNPCGLSVGTTILVSTVSEFQNAIGQLNNAGGDHTILIADGDYQIASTSSFPYITGSNVVIRSASGNRDAVIIRGGGNVPTYSTEDGFLIAGDNVTIADLTIREVGNHGIQVSGHNLYVHNVRIQDTYEQMIKGSTTAATIENGTVQCSLFEYTQGIGPNWYIGGLDIHKGHSWMVRDNVFRNIISPHTAVSEHAVHFWNDCFDNTVERNLIYNCDRGIGFGLGTNGNQNQGGVIRNNMIYNDGLGQYDDVGIGLETSPDTKVYNNTIFIDYFNAIEYRFATTSNVEIYNNLTNKAIASRNGGTGTLLTNVTNAQSNWFVNTTSGDLHVASMIAEVFDQGTEIPAFVVDDIDQNPRPYNAQTDIGADELLLTGILVDEDGIEILSDPINNIYTITGTLSDYTITVLDINGSLVYTVPSNGFSTSFDLSTLPSSYYFILITNNSNGSVCVQKIIRP